MGHSELARVELEHVLFPKYLGVSAAHEVDINLLHSNAESEDVTSGR